MSDCFNHIGATCDGYGVKKHKGKSVRAHRLAYCIAKNIKLREIDGLVIRHSCDNRMCVNPDHLSAGTHADNCADKVAKGRQARGEDIGNSKLITHEVRSIKKLLKMGYSRKEIALHYDVSAMCISRIASGKTWVHV